MFLVQLVRVGLAGCRDSFMRRDSGGHGAGTPQWTSSGQWSPSNPTIDAFSPHCATYGHSEECITGTLRQTHPIQRARSKLLKNSEHSNGVNLLSFLTVQRAQSCELIKFKGKACPEFFLAAPFSAIMDFHSPLTFGKRVRQWDKFSDHCGLGVISSVGPKSVKNVISVAVLSVYHCISVLSVWQ